MSSEQVVKSADRVLDLLEHLGCARRPMPLAEISQELGFPKSSTLGLLRTLQARGYVTRDEADGYALAHPFGQQEGDWAGGLPRLLAGLARPVVDELVARTQETVNLGLLRGGTVRLVLQVASPQEIRYEPRAMECPAYCTAMGRILLGFAAPRTVEAILAAPLGRLTPTTLTDPAAIRARIADARRQGFAEIDGEYAEGGAGAAAPVFDRQGRAVAALNIASLTPRWSRHRDTFIPALLDAARQLTQRLEGQPPPDRS